MSKLSLTFENIDHFHAPFDFSPQEKIQGQTTDVNAVIPKPMVEHTHATVDPFTLQTTASTPSDETTEEVTPASVESFFADIATKWQTNSTSSMEAIAKDMKALSKHITQHGMSKAAMAAMENLMAAAKASQAATEGCTECAQGNTTPNAQNLSGSAPATSDQRASFTYNDTSNKEKEIILLSGPLGEAYTQALNVKFTKKPLFKENSMPDNLSEQEQDLYMNANTPSTESQQQDAQEIAQLTSAMNFIEAKKEEVDNTFIFLNNNHLAIGSVPSKGKVTEAIVATPEQLFDPERVEDVCERAKTKKVIVVCHVPTDMASIGLRIKEDFVDLNDDTSLRATMQRVSRSLMNVYSSENIEVVMGMESLGHWLLDKTN